MEGLVPLVDAECYLIDHFLEKKQADALFRELIDSCKWHQPEITLFGKKIASPRLSAWYGDADAVYKYSGFRNEPQAWLPGLFKLKHHLTDSLNAPLNSVLVNNYRDGQDSMGWHADDEGELGDEAVIASISLGEVRSFLMKHRFRDDVATTKLQLGHGSLLVMQGQTQKFWKHAIPKTRRHIKQRLNLTFRQINPITSL